MVLLVKITKHEVKKLLAKYAADPGAPPTNHSKVRTFAGVLERQRPEPVFAIQPTMVKT